LPRKIIQKILAVTSLRELEALQTPGIQGESLKQRLRENLLGSSWSYLGGK
jgi:hypothetical protein